MTGRWIIKCRHGTHARMESRQTTTDRDRPRFTRKFHAFVGQPRKEERVKEKRSSLSLRDDFSGHRQLLCQYFHFAQRHFNGRKTRLHGRRVDKTRSAAALYPPSVRARARARGTFRPALGVIALRQENTRRPVT